MIEKAVTALGVLASIALLAASVTINAEFAYSRGVTEHQAITYAGAAAAADLLKSLFAFFALWSLQAGAYTRAVASIAFAALVTVYSLSSAIGLIAESRDARSTEGKARNERLVDVTKQRSDAEAQLKQIALHRSVTELEAAINAKLALPVVAGRRVRGTLWQVSEDCKVVDRGTRESCAELGILREELGRAKAAESLKTSIDALRQQQIKLSEKGAGREPDGQVRAFADMLRRQVGEMNLALAILLALVVEAGSSLGLFVASGHNLTAFRSGTSVGLSPRAPGTLAIEDYWMERLFPAPGEKASFSDILEDYFSHCAHRSLAPLEAEVFKRTFETICRQIGLTTAHGFAFGVRVGEDRIIEEAA